MFVASSMHEALVGLLSEVFKELLLVAPTKQTYFPTLVVANSAD